MSELTKSFIGTSHQQCYSGYRQRTRNNKCSLQTEQRKYWKTPRWINGDTSKVSKTCRHRNPRNFHRRPQGVRMAKRAGMAPGRWRKVAKAVAPRERTRTRASYEYCSNRNKTRTTIWLETIQYLQPNQKLHCLLHEVQDEAEGYPQSRQNSSGRANTVSVCSNRKLPECFEVYSKQKRNLQNIKHCQIATL